MSFQLFKTSIYQAVQQHFYVRNCKILTKTLRSCYGSVYEMCESLHKHATLFKKDPGENRIDVNDMSLIQNGDTIFITFDDDDDFYTSDENDLGEDPFFTEDEDENDGKCPQFP